MQREELMRSLGRRLSFSATFIRYGVNRNNEVTMLFEDVKQDGKYVADHIWVYENQGFENIILEKDDIVHFQALVSIYRRIYDIDAQLKEFKNIVVEKPKT